MKILVIDDAADIRLFVSAILEGAGHQVLSAEDPMKAISLLSVADVDALILDVRMPRFTGFELLEILRRDARMRLLPVLLLSSLDESEERLRGLQLGAADYLPKPFDPEELVARVERMVNRPVSPGGAAGDLEETGLISVLQRLEQEERSGALRIGSTSHGWIELKEGKPAGAQYGLLAGAEAILSMLTLRDSRFRFEPATEEEIRSAGVADLQIPQLASKAAELEEELSRCLEDLPAEDAGLFVAGSLSTGAHPVPDLPLEEIYERIDTLPGVTLEELISHQFFSAIKVRLAVAVLARAAVIEAVIEGARATEGEPAD